MPSTRSSARLAGNSSSPVASSSTSPSSSRKRKAASPKTTPSKSKKTKQATLEDVVPDADAGNEDDDVKMPDTEENGAEEDTKDETNGESKEETKEETKDESKAKSKADSKDAAKDEAKDDAKEASKEDTTNGTKDEPKEEPKSSAAEQSSKGVVKSSEERANEMPANILEKGIFYFFARGRVGIDDPSAVNEIARSFLVLRPLPLDAKLGEGPLPDASNLRLIAIPKKVLPKSPQDRFMVFVEKGAADIKTLKDEFLSGSEYETQAGARHSPPVTPMGEGVYAITETERTAHLVYMTTIPAELGDVQKSVGLADKGSFVMSTKNPKYEGPANAQLPEGPGFSDTIQEAFNARRWMPTHPSHLQYPNAQFLLIGEGHEEFKKAVEPTEKDEKSPEKEVPQDEIEKLEGEDEARAQQLDFESAVFKDLAISKQGYPEMKTTW